MSHAAAAGTGTVPAPAAPLTAANERHGGGDAVVPVALAESHYRGLAGFRFFIRRFFAFSERRVERAGLAPAQYQAMLAIRAHAGPRPMTVSALAEQLYIRPNSALELVQRLEAAGLVRRVRPAEDRRRVELSLTPHGQSTLATLAAAHLAEIREHMSEMLAVVELLSRAAV